MAQLVDVATYRRVTNDTAGADPAVTTALTDAQQLAGEHCHRDFAYGSHTETLYVNRNGLVYPANTPIATITDPANLAPTAIQGAGVYLGYFLPVPAMVNAGDWNAAVPPQAAITYTGGYQPIGTTDGPTPQIPGRLARILCRIAYLILHPVVLDGLPVGVKSASVNGVSVSGSFEQLAAVDPSLRADLQPYRHRQARGWQS